MADDILCEPVGSRSVCCSRSYSRAGQRLAHDGKGSDGAGMTGQRRLLLAVPAMAGTRGERALCRATVPGCSASTSWHATAPFAVCAHGRFMMGCGPDWQGRREGRGSDGIRLPTCSIFVRCSPRVLLIHCRSSLRPLKFALVMFVSFFEMPDGAAQEDSAVLHD